jgi:hypothetical protein
MSVKQTDLADVIALTINDLPKQEFEVGWDNQDYEACRIYQNERMVIDGGNQIERKIMLDNSGNARYRRAYDTDSPAVGDVMHTIKAPWVRIGSNYSWDDFEILQNKNNAKGFIDLMKVRRIDGLWALAELIEDRFWKTPETSTDDLYPYGVPYYLSFYTDTSGTVNSSNGFLGKAVKFQDGNYSYSRANINSNTEAKWRNYCALYTAVDNALLKTFRLAFMYTKFKAPLFVDDPANAASAAKRVYTDFDTVAQLMDLADQKDDRHTGKDILSNLKVDDTGLCRVNRLPVVPVSQLNGASYTPMYCVDFRKFKPYVHDGYWMRETGPETDRSQHTTFTMFLDGAHNNICLNLRTAGFVLHKAS